MSSYSRPFHKSSRVRHFVAGAGGALVLVTLLAATRVGIAPLSPREPLGVVVDVVDVPCTEPFDELVEVIPDTLNGNSRVHIVVRNQACCCCGVDERSNARLIDRGGVRRSGVRPIPEPEPEPSEGRRDTVASARQVLPTLMTPIPPVTGPAPAFGEVAAAPLAAGAPATSGINIPWWLALGTTALYFVTGREDRPPGGVCDDDDLGSNSGPPRNGCWPLAQPPLAPVRRVL